jgi:hypothetical protein
MTSTTIPSPADGVIRLTDKDLGASYVEFPEDTFFLESLAQNTAYAPGVAYVPAQRLINGKEESHLYEIRPGMTAAKHLAGPIAAPDGSTDVTIFGSALNSKGMLYLCAFNRNSIIGLDITKLPDEPGPVKCSIEVEGLASPNDVGIDPKNESILYVAGGTFRRFCCCYEFANSVFGCIYKVVLDKSGSTGKTSVQSQGFKTLAGIEVVDNQIWTAQLFDIFHQNEKGGEVTVAWKGNDGKGDVWMADNIDTFDNDMILCPAYSTVSEAAVNTVMKRTVLLSAALLYLQISTACMRGENFREAILDPEVSLKFSNTYIAKGVDPAPVRLIFTKPNNPEQTFHFEVDLVGTRAKNAPRTIKDRDGKKVLGQRHFFNEQVTHAAHMKDANGKGYIVCVNFEQPRILFLEDAKFSTAMIMGATTPAVTE